MNALNIISGLGSAPSSSSRSRTSSLANLQTYGRKESEPSTASVTSEKGYDVNLSDSDGGQDALSSDDEKTPLIQPGTSGVEGQAPSPNTWRLVPKRVADAIVTSVKVVITTILAPATYVIACFYDSNGNFSAMLPIRRLYHLSPRKRRRKSHPSPILTSSLQSDEDHKTKPRLRPKRQPTATYAAAPAAESSDGFKSESSDGEPPGADDSPARNTRSKTSTTTEEEVPRRSTRIKIETGSNRGHRAQRSIDGSRGNDDDRLTAVANALKSPGSPATKLKYPRAPVPQRPLVPRRQPSYANLYNPEAPKKTLILDLDETLIHSMAKGGRMSTGHMVEVKFQGPVAGGGVVLGPQVPILYYVHERPHCHEFLRKVCKWFKLIVFTASVQEYADPVIDWLERERAYFVGRYYRQHCTLRNGAYIKDLSTVEPDLSKVMILDNSPMSYIFHEDNAIPIEGWISDPTDNDLLHLIPFLEGLQYVTDVRALLALRMGQTERS
ncbi:Nuclear envelope morphology protein 1 [Sphaceloma murrayae]|uniref:Nuclear envelope morphology protein 1 n=1 Tax=Sphaceloma murrayae TaxID=2082308 RepID=A0A2K1QWZ8_9PEZI|nr:Nuclear envelope morphology protein 1 [Sphaceloma murrayae]